LFRTILLGLSAGSLLFASWDAGKDLNTAIGERTDGQVQLIFELRSRLENRPGQSFGAEPDLFADFTRFRIGISYKPVKWLRFVAVGMDARAPLYGTPAPSSARDPMDLHEAYIELRPDTKEGFGAVVGRQAVNLGDTRLIGSPQWAYIPRIYDGARVFWRGRKYRLEGLFISPVKLRTDGWNYPVLGDRVIGTYNTVEFNKHVSTDLYLLRHHQNRPGGFQGSGRSITNSIGTRVFGPIANGFRYTAEIIGQVGDIGPVSQRANAWALQVGKQTKLAGRPLDVSGEYKFASGGIRSDRISTFDQLFPAAHDKLGHADVLGWKNVRNLKALGVWSWTKSFAVNVMYNNSWLADPRDAAYNSSGRAVARSTTGLDGRHIGQEADLFVTYKKSGWTTGAGYGYFFSGEFIRRTTPAVDPQYMYVYQSYSF
jgi:hypothetical protein